MQHSYGHGHDVLELDFPHEQVHHVYHGIRALDEINWVKDPFDLIGALANTLGSAAVDIVATITHECHHQPRLNREVSSHEVIEFFTIDETLKFLYLRSDLFQKRPKTLQELAQIRRDLLFCTNAQALIQTYPEIDEFRPSYLPLLAVLNKLQLEQSIMIMNESLKCSVCYNSDIQRLKKNQREYYLEEVERFTSSLHEMLLHITQFIPRDEEIFNILMDQLR